MVGTPEDIEGDVGNLVTVVVEPVEDQASQIISDLEGPIVVGRSLSELNYYPDVGAVDHPRVVQLVVDLDSLERRIVGVKPQPLAVVDDHLWEVLAQTSRNGHLGCVVLRLVGRLVLGSSGNGDEGQALLLLSRNGDCL